MCVLTWAAPLLILPGVGLLIASTSARYTRLHDELHHLGDHGGSHEGLRELLWRGRLFRNALVGCYVAVMLLASAGLVLGFGLTESGMALGVEGLGLLLTFAGVAAVVVVSGLLCAEALISFRVLDREVREALKRHPDNAS